MALAVDAAVVHVEPLPCPLQQNRRRQQCCLRPGQPREAAVTLVEDVRGRVVEHGVAWEQQQRPVFARHLRVGGDGDLLGQVERGLQPAGEHHQDLVVGVLVQAALGLDIAEPELDGGVGGGHGSLEEMSWSVRSRPSTCSRRARTRSSPSASSRAWNSASSRLAIWASNTKCSKSKSSSMRPRIMSSSPTTSSNRLILASRTLRIRSSTVPLVTRLVSSTSWSWPMRW